MSGPRRLQLRGADERVAIGIGVCAGIGAALSGLSPTGSTVSDWIVLIGAIAAAVWAAATAPWWALTALAALATAIAEPWLPLLLGGGLVALSLFVGATQRSQPVERAAIAGGAIVVLSFGRELGFFGASSIVGIGAVVAVAALGVSRRSSRVCKRVYVVAGCVAAAGVLAGMGLAIAAASARPDLTEGNRVARDGLRQLGDGDFDAAQSSFERAADSFERAADDLGSLYAQPSRLLPVAGQHRYAGATLAAAAADATRVVDGTLDEIDFDSLTIVDGRIDIEAVRSLKQPMIDLQAALDRLDQAALDVADPWLIDRLEVELSELRSDIAEQRELGDQAIQALEVAPAMLGADEERVYFVMFTSPAEARGTGGFMGSFAEISIDDGRIRMTEFGRTGDLTRAADGDLVLHDPPPDWLARYGTEGFAVGPEGKVARDIWSVINLSPHFPYTAYTIADFYPQSGGRELDGVFSIDVETLAALIGLVGPITVDDGDLTIDGDNAAQYLLVDQYRLNEDKPERIDELETVGREVATRLLSTAPPDPLDLGRAMAPLVDERRVLGWFRRAEEEAILDMIDMDGQLLAEIGEADAMTVVVVNDGASKLDTYLDRDITLAEDDGNARLDVVLRHDAPVDTLPPYVLGSTSELPDGWSRLWVTLNTTVGVAGATIDGDAAGLSFTQEADRNNYGLFVELAPGAVTRVSFELTEPVLANDLIIDPQPLVRDETWTAFGQPLGPVATRQLVTVG